MAKKDFFDEGVRVKVSPKLLFFVTEDWYFCSHRLPLALAAKEAGYEVVVVTKVSKHADLIRSSGLRLIPINISRRGSNPFVELLLICRLYGIYRHERPDVVHNIALKPILYGAFVALLAKVPSVVNTFAGLGYLFVSKSNMARRLRPFIEFFLRFLLNQKNSRVILQNPDDINFLISRKIILRNKAVLIRGSGVELQRFIPSSEPVGPVVVLLASRMLWDKGVGAFVDAARYLIKNGVDAKFVLVGEGDSDNPASIPNETLKEWAREGYIEWWGNQNDMPGIFAKSHIVCLPSSYGEGVPKVLIEAAACEKPIVTSDTPGCREIVSDGVNGFLVPIGSVSELSNALERLIKNKSLRKSMGKAGRVIVRNEFCITIVVQKTLNLYHELVAL